MQIYLFGGVGTGKKTLKNTLNRQKEERNEGQWSTIDIPGYTSEHTLKNGNQCLIILVVTPDSVGSSRSKDLSHMREIFEQLGIQKNMYALIINKFPPGLEQQGVDKESLLLNWDSEMSIPANCPKKPIQCLKLHSDKTNWKRP